MNIYETDPKSNQFPLRCRLTLFRQKKREGRRKYADIWHVTSFISIRRRSHTEAHFIFAEYIATSHEYRSGAADVEWFAKKSTLRFFLRAPRRRFRPFRRKITFAPSSFVFGRARFELLKKKSCRRREKTKDRRFAQAETCIFREKKTDVCFRFFRLFLIWSETFKKRRV